MRAVLAFAAISMTFAGVAQAQICEPPVVGRPASSLIFPLVDSRANKGTLISITNTDTDRRTCTFAGFREGDVCVHLTFFGQDVLFNHCREFDLDICLTPGDTVTFIADQINPNMEIGWLWAEARDPETFEPIEFDHLIGSALVVDLNLQFLARYIPYGFQALCEFGADNCHHGLIDCNGDGFADFGTELSAWPAELYLDSFFQEGGTNPTFTDQIALASCETTGTTFVTTFVWNNREQRFSRDFEFVCFFLGSIGDIQVVAQNLRGDPNELIGPSGEILQTGWLHLIPQNAPILGVFIERIANTSFGGGDVLEFDGCFNCSLQRLG